MQKNNEELKAVLQTVINENRRLEEVISQMMREITFLREALLSTVLKLASGSVGGGVGGSSAIPVTTSANQSGATALTTTSARAVGTKSSVAGVTSVKSGTGTISAMKSPGGTTASAWKSPVSTTGTSVRGSTATKSSVKYISGAKSPTVTSGTGTGSSIAPVKSSVGAASTKGATWNSGGVKSVFAGAGIGGGNLVSVSYGTSGDSKSPSATTTGGGGGGATGITGATTGAAATTGTSDTGRPSASAEVENYITAMMAGGGPRGGIKTSDSSTSVGGGLKEFSLYCAAGTGIGGGMRSTYVDGASSGTTDKTRDINFAFGNTNDQLGGGGGGGGGSSGSSSGGSASSSFLKNTSVYL
uniref:Uncharacterized protein n=1 Tax=Setaria digitata TaxID=48799 RepID=A0A915Q1I9_9BILA